MCLLQSHVQASAQSLDKLQDGRGFRFRIDFITSLAVESRTAAEIVAR
jgi:hypothetical protein